MKNITKEWLALAKSDLLAAERLLSEPALTNIVAFHAQQAVEKSMKAVVEELGLGVIKTHNLVRLCELIRPHLSIVSDWDMLDRLDAVYIEARYPGDLGLLPFGKPSQEEAKIYFDFAVDIFNQILLALESHHSEY